MDSSDPEVSRRSIKQSASREGHGPASGPVVPPDCFFCWSENYGWFCSVLKQSSHQVLQNSAFEFLSEMTKKWIVHWINHTHFFDPKYSFRTKLRTSTHTNLESHLPASKRSRSREIDKMEIRNPQWPARPTILWQASPTEVDRFFGWLYRLASLILNWCLFLNLFHCWWVERFLDRWIPLMQCLKIKSCQWRIWICKKKKKKRFPIYHVCPKC